MLWFELNWCVPGAHLGYCEACSYINDINSCRYEGRDWRNQDSWFCEGSRDLFSGMDSNFAALQEAMFIPGKEGVLQTSDELLDVASAYERWMEQQASIIHCPLLSSPQTNLQASLRPADAITVHRIAQMQAAGRQEAALSISHGIPNARYQEVVSD